MCTGDEISSPDGDPYEIYRILFDLTFFFFVIVILLAIIQGQSATCSYPSLWWTHTHTAFNGPLSRTTLVSRYQKGKTNLDFTEARDSEWQWHQLGHMQVCTSLQTDDHASNPPLSFFTGRMPFLPPNQQCQGTEGITSIIHVVPKMGRTSRELTNKWKLHSHVSRLHELLRGNCLNFRGTNSAPPDELATLTTEVH